MGFRSIKLVDVANAADVPSALCFLLSITSSNDPFSSNSPFQNVFGFIDFRSSTESSAVKT